MTTAQPQTDLSAVASACSEESALQTPSGESSPAASEGQPASRRYRDRVNNFSIILPWNWHVQPSVGDLYLVAKAPPNAGSHGLGTVLGITSSQLAEKVDLDLYYEIGRAALQVQFPQSVILDEGTTKICNLPAKWVLLTHFVEQGQQAILLHYYFTTHAGKQAYVISIHSPAANFTAERPLLETIAHSFREEYRY